LEACRDLKVNLVYFHTIKPIDRDAILKFKNTKILVVHDAFGLYEAVCEVPNLSTACHGMPDEFFSCYGTVYDIRKKIGLDPEGIRQAILLKLGAK
jgi:transketolase